MTRLWLEAGERARPADLAELWRALLGSAPRPSGGAAPRSPQRAPHVHARDLRRSGRLGARAVVLRARALRSRSTPARRPRLAGRRHGSAARLLLLVPQPVLVPGGAARLRAAASASTSSSPSAGVIPMAMRGQSVPRAKRLHTLRDADREAARLGMPFGRIHDPIGDGRDALPARGRARPRRRSRARVRARGQPRRSGPRRSTSRATTGCGRCASGPGSTGPTAPAALENDALPGPRAGEHRGARGARPLGRAAVRLRGRAVLGSGPDRGRRDRPAGRGIGARWRPEPPNLVLLITDQQRAPQHWPADPAGSTR